MRPKLSYANVVATLALFVALGGSSYAAVQLGANSVKSRNIGKGQVRSSDIARNSVNSSKVRDSSLLARDFKPGQLPAGPAGERGEAGPRGEKGDPGDPGLSGLERVYVSGTLTASESPKSAVAKCAAGKVAISGGYDISGGKDPDVGPNGLTNVVPDVIETTSPTTVPGQVFVEAWEEEPTALSWKLSAIAICADVAP